VPNVAKQHVQMEQCEKSLQALNCLSILGTSINHLYMPIKIM
jgi:hypothetical protein